MPDSTQILRLLEAGDLGCLVATFDELQVIYRKSLREIDSPIEHLFRAVQIAGRSAEYLSSGKTPLIEQVGGLYLQGQRVEASSVEASGHLVSCEFCQAAVSLHHLRCNNCGAAVKLTSA